jgi:hypothetical protein
VDGAQCLTVEGMHRCPECIQHCRLHIMCVGAVLWNADDSCSDQDCDGLVRAIIDMQSSELRDLFI